MRQLPVEGMSKYSGLLRTFAVVYREEGMVALYGGLTAHLMRVVPNAAILFFCYELIVRLGNAHLSSSSSSSSLPTSPTPPSS
jgi:solute carrier family 25 protein 33/36